MNPQAKARALYRERFGHEPQALVRAPGRVNLIGEHTDYNDGFVLPCAIDFETAIAIGPRDDGQISVVASNYPGEHDGFGVDCDPAPHPTQLWCNYVRGVAQQFHVRKLAVPAMNMAISGDIPQGAGLSSSAALEVAVGTTFNHAGRLGLSAAELALIGQAAENHFVGCNCGIMDQMVSARGERNHALLLDCRSLETRLIPMPDDLTVLIVHSGVKRGLVDSEYNTRRQQCEAAARHYGVPALRDVTLKALESGKAGLDDLSYRRARHIVSENARTLAAAEALAGGDLVRLGELMAQSHASMRDDFEITVPAIDGLVEILREAIGDEGGARMTGGGFGGCVVALLRPERLAAAIAAVERDYPARFGLKPQIYQCKASQGAGVVA